MRYNKIKITGIVLLALTSILFVGCNETEGGDTNAPDKETANAVSVQVTTVQSQEYTDYINMVGALKPIDKAALGHTTGGIIEEIVKDKGSWASEGDVIVIMDNDELKASMEAAEAQYKLAEANFEKQELIFKDKVNSEIQMLESKYNRDQAKANYERIKAQYEKTFIKAPFSGVVDAKYYEESELAAPGAPIVDLINASRIKIEAGVPERYVGQVEIGDRARITMTSVNMEPVYGKVTYVGTSISPSSRTFPIEVTINNRDGKLKPELVAEVAIENGTFDDVFTIPDDVILRTDEGFVVFIAEDGRARSSEVDIIARFDNKAAIRSGVKEGDKLITIGYQNLVEGQKINVVK